MFCHHGRDMRSACYQSRLKRRDFIIRQGSSHRVRCTLIGRVRSIYNNYSTVSIVTDAVRYVTEQKFFSTCHAKIANHQDIDCFLLSSMDDRQCWISINDDQGMATFSGNLPRKVCQVIVGSHSTRLFGFTEFCGGWIFRYYYLYYE